MKNLKIYFTALLIFSLNFLHAQDEDRTYHLNKKIDIPLTVVALGATYFGFERINGKDDATFDELRALDKEDINAFDRPAAGNNSESAEKLSDAFFYGAFPLGAVLIADGRVRSELGTIAFMYLEAMAVSSAIYATTNGYVDRFRPLTYQNNSKLTDEEMKAMDLDYHGNKNSFIGGHPMITATSTFFIAKVFHDLHPDNKWRYAVWGAAGAATATCAYLRYAAGKHFPTDLIAGVSVGVLSGILVPQFHKTKRDEGGFSMTPIMGAYNGVSMNYTF